jgi:hypothetical protein
MKNILSYVEQAKEHPHSVRKQIAFIVASVGAGFVGFIWLSVSIATGSFAIADPFAPRNFVGGDKSTPNSQFAAVGATFSADEEEKRPRIEIVDAVQPALQKETEQTFIPF